MPDELPLPAMPAFVGSILARVRGKAETGLLAVGFAGATIVLGIVGWALRLFDGFAHSVALIALKSFAAFTPSLKNLEGGNTLTDASAVCSRFTRRPPLSSPAS